VISLCDKHARFLLRAARSVRDLSGPLYEESPAIWTFVMAGAVCTIFPGSFTPIGDHAFCGCFSSEQRRERRKTSTVCGTMAGEDRTDRAHRRRLQPLSEALSTILTVEDHATIVTYCNL